MSLIPSRSLTMFRPSARTTFLWAAIPCALLWLTRVASQSLLVTCSSEKTRRREEFDGLQTRIPPVNESESDILNIVVGYFEAQGAHQIISFQCDPLDKAALLRLASNRGLLAQFPAGTSVRRHDELLFSRVGVFVDTDCPRGVQVAEQASRELRFNGSFVWFLWDPSRSVNQTLNDVGAVDLEDDLLDIVAGLNLAVDSTVALGLGSGPVRLLEVHKVHYDMPLRVTPLVVTPPEASGMPSKKVDLTGLTIRAVGVGIRSSEYGWNQFSQYLEGFIRDEDPADIFKQGPRLFDLARQLFNFTFVMRTVPGGGQLLSNGSCSGIPGYLQRGEFDVALLLWLDAARMQCVQYLAYNLITFDSVLVYRMPTRSSSAMNSQVIPFSSGSWAGVFIMFGMMALLLLIADEFHLEEAFGNLGPWSAALIFGTAGISWGSVHYGINSTHLISVELGTVIGGLTYTVIFTYYQSSVVFGLLAKDTRPPLTPQEVIERDFRIVSDDFTYFKDLFETTNDTDLREIHQRFLSAENAFVSLELGARMVKNEHVALIGDMTAVAKQLNPIMTSQQLCSVRYTAIHAERSLLYSAARKEWPLADLVRRGLVLAMERGLSRRIVRPFRMPCSTDDSTATQTTISAFTVTAATTAYLTLFIGYVVSGSFCGLETLGPQMERTIDKFIETRRVSVLFRRRRSRLASIATLSASVVPISPQRRIQFFH